jgi:hypothetical protein
MAIEHVSSAIVITDERRAKITANNLRVGDAIVLYQKTPNGQIALSSILIPLQDIWLPDRYPISSILSRNRHQKQDNEII